MRRTKLTLATISVTLIISCGTKSVMEEVGNVSTVDRNGSTVKTKELVLTPSNPLLVSVHPDIENVVIQRIKMDLNPDLEHFRNTNQLARKDIPAIDFSSLTFVPVISNTKLPDLKSDSVLSVDKEFACMYGKTEKGEDIFIQARYTDWKEIVQNARNDLRYYQERVKTEGKEIVDEGLKKLESRKYIDSWRISIFRKKDILFHLMDYARKQSDNGEFFILTQGKHHHEICYFKDGNPLSCQKTRIDGKIKVRELSSLLR